VGFIVLHAPTGENACCLRLFCPALREMDVLNVEALDDTVLAAAGQASVAAGLAAGDGTRRGNSPGQLQAHILGSMSHLALHAGHGDDAVRLAERGGGALTRIGTAPAMRARSLAMAASGYATLGNPVRVYGFSSAPRMSSDSDRRIRHHPGQDPSMRARWRSTRHVAC
jgi:hypothetical protein